MEFSCNCYHDDVGFERIPLTAVRIIEGRRQKGALVSGGNSGVAKS